jgi:GNAT superfamily N-acetyltransferase
VPKWVPPLKADLRLLFDRAKNPFFEHATVESWLALDGERVVGRISAVDNRAHNEFHGDRAGFFGFFECEDDPAAARALFDTAAAWLVGRGKDLMRGPMNFSTNDDCGSLVEGFDLQPAIMMPYNLPYHAALYAANGFAKAKDLIAYWMDRPELPERLERAVELLGRRKGIVTRPMDMKHFDRDVAIIRRIYNDAWEKNWGFVPMTEHEIDHMAKQLKPVVDPEIVVFAEVKGEPIGFGLALPDYNIALKHAGGELLPFGFLALLWHRRNIHQARVLTLGVKAGYRATGVDVLLYHQLFHRCRRRGYPRGEFSWVLEDNLAMRRPLENMGGVHYKTYRIYDRPLAGAAGPAPGAGAAP